MLVYSNVKKEDLIDLISSGFDIIDDIEPYQVLKLTNKKIHLTLFTSGKLVIGGKEKDISNFVKKYNFDKFNKVYFANRNENFMGENVIGSDEALKGDTFGGMVVCSFYVAEDDVQKIKQIGIKDSKKFDKEKIMFLAEQIKKEFPESYFIKEVSPKEYNELISIETMTKLLNDMHSFAGIILKQRFGEINHIVDEYPGCNVGDVRITGAESKYLAVACASILAKARGLEQINELSKKIGFQLPLGSTHVKEALDKLKMSKNKPELFCKINFKNVKKVFNM